MNPQFLSYFATGKLADFGWVIFLFYAHDYLGKDQVLAGLCIVGAIVTAALGVWHKSKNKPIELPVTGATTTENTSLQQGE